MPEMTPPEARTYRLLRQVCEQYLRAQDLPLLQLYSTVLIFLGQACLSWLSAVDSPGLVADVMGELTARLRTRLSGGDLPALEVPVSLDPMRQVEGEPSWSLMQALVALVNEAQDDYHFGLEGSLRIALSLLADVLLVWHHTFALDFEETLALLGDRVVPALAHYIATNRP